MARILIVEDEEKIARFVTLELEHEATKWSTPLTAAPPWTWRWSATTI